MEKLKILITPSYESTRDTMGFSEDDDYDGDAVLFQQGYDMDVMEVEPGEKFKIIKNFKGQVNSEEYKFIKLKEEWQDESDEWEEDYYRKGDPITLTPGWYKFLDDGLTIEELSKKDR